MARAACTSIAIAVALAILPSTVSALDIKEVLAKVCHKDPKPRTAPCYVWELREVKETVYDVTISEREDRTTGTVVKDIVRDRTEVYTRPMAKTVLETATVARFPYSNEGSADKVVHRVFKDEHGCWQHTEEPATRSITCVTPVEKEIKYEARKWVGVPTDNKYTCRYLKQEEENVPLAYQSFGYKPRQITVQKWVRVPYFPPKPCCDGCAAEPAPAPAPETKEPPKPQIKSESKVETKK